MLIYILLYNPGTENEGVHTLQIGDRNTVLMFESEDDASRFALMLEAQDFPTPIVEAIEAEEVEEFCRDAGYDWKVIEEGMLAVPPETNIEETEWNLEGEYQKTVTESETASEMSGSELDRIRRQLEGLL
jgi:hypothetical protein